MKVREAFRTSALLVMGLSACSSGGSGGAGDNAETGTGGSGASGSPTATNAANGGAGTLQTSAAPTSAATNAGGAPSVSSTTGDAAGGSSGEAGDAGAGSGGATTTTGSGDVPPIDCRSDGDDRTTLVFVNRCPVPITVRGSEIEDASVAAGEFVCRDIGSAAEELSSKRYWGFSGEDPGAEHHTLAEFTFNTDFNDFDWYNISHVDAFNLPMQIVPVARPDCATLTCADDLLGACPEAGQFKADDGEVVACVSPDRDDGTSPVAEYFESCDDAYAWSGDDQNGDDPSPVRACAGEDWDIVFCPAGVE
jgi:hypothetical protein